MKTEAQALKRLLRLHDAVRTCVVNDHDKRPKNNLYDMSKRFVFVAAQERRNLTGSLINIEVYARLMSIARGIIVANAAAAAIACGLAAYFSIDAAVRVAVVLLIGGVVVGYRVRADFNKLLNFEKLAAFMTSLDKAASLLNPTETRDQLMWLRCSSSDLAAHAVSVVEATLQHNKVDEAKLQMKLFTSLGLVNGEPLKRLKRLAEEKAAVTA